MPVEGRDLSSRQTKHVVKDLEIGQPINSAECSETAEGVARESKGVKSCPRAGCGKSSCPVVRPARLACSAGDKPAGATVRSPVAWIAGWRATKTLKPIDKVSLGGSRVTGP